MFQSKARPQFVRPQCQPTLELLEPRLLLSGNLTGIELTRNLYESSDMSDTDPYDQYSYTLEVVGSDLRGIKIVSPWGNFNSADKISEWYGNDLDTDYGDVHLKAWIDSNGLGHLSVDWWNLSNENWIETGKSPAEVEVYYDGGSWSGEVVGDGMDVSSVQPHLTSPVYLDEILPPQPTFEWTRWQAPANSQIKLSIHTDYTDDNEVLYDVTLDANQTQWTPPQSLMDMDPYIYNCLNVDVRFVADRTDNSLDVPIVKHSVIETDCRFSMDESVVVIGHHSGAVSNGWNFEDYDGDIVTPTLTGPGWAELIFNSDTEDNELLSIRFHDTNKTSRFKLAVRQQGDGDGLVEIWDAVGSGDASLGVLNLRQVDWGNGDGIFFNGNIGTLRLNDGTSDDNVITCPLVVIACESSDKMRLTTGYMRDFDLVYSGTLNASVGELAYGSFHAYRIASMTVYGDVDGTEIVAGSGGIGRITVIGGDLFSDISTDGSIGNIAVISVKVYDEDGEATRLGGNIDFVAITAGGGIGRVTLVGGDIWGAEMTSGGAIGSISVKGVLDYDENGNPTVYGGNIVDCSIQAGDSGDERIGRIILHGGNLGSEDTPIDINCGSLGKIKVRSIRCVTDTTEMPVLNRRGQARVNTDGEEMTRTSPVYELSGGEAWVNILAAGKIDSIRVSGGSLGGRIEAAGGIGEIVLRSRLLVAPSHHRGMPVVSSDDQIAVADLLADIIVGSGPKGRSIDRMSLRGGSIRGDVNATGYIGRITARSFGIVGDDGPDLEGGSILSNTFQTTGVGRLKLSNPQAGILPPIL